MIQSGAGGVRMAGMFKPLRSAGGGGAADAPARARRRGADAARLPRRRGRVRGRLRPPRRRGVLAGLPDVRPARARRGRRAGGVPVAVAQSARATTASAAACARGCSASSTTARSTRCAGARRATAGSSTTRASRSGSSRRSAPTLEFARREEAREIRDALEQLPDEQSRVIELAYFGGLTHVADRVDARHAGRHDQGPHAPRPGEDADDSRRPGGGGAMSEDDLPDDSAAARTPHRTCSARSTTRSTRRSARIWSPARCAARRWRRCSVVATPLPARSRRTLSAPPELKRRVMATVQSEAGWQRASEARPAGSSAAAPLAGSALGARRRRARRCGRRRDRGRLCPPAAARARA